MLRIMKFFLHSILLVLLFSGFQNPTQAQDYSLAISSASFTADGKTFAGYQTSFTQPFKEIKKEWWRYIKTKTYIYNAKTYYILTIPAKEDSNMELDFISALENSRNRTYLNVAQVEQGLSSEQQAQLNKDLKNLLIDFKIQYYTDILQTKIDSKEREIKKLSRTLYQQKKKGNSNAQLEQRLTSSHSDLERLKGQLAKIR